MIKNNISFEKLGLIVSKVPKSYILNIIEYSISKTLKKPAALCVVLISDIEIKKINNKFRKKNSVTTCLSFPLGAEDSSISINNLGDIFINIDRIKKYSQDYKKELAFNLIHSYLHLIGFSHSKNSDAKKMEVMEKIILKGIL